MSIRDRVRDRGGFMSRLRRYPSRGWVAGVCAGLAEYFDWNVKLLRVIFVAALVCSGFFPIGVIYIALWYLLEESDGSDAGGDPHHEPRSYASARAHGADHRGDHSYSGRGDVKTRFTRLEERLRSMEECVSSNDFELRRELKKLET